MYSFTSSSHLSLINTLEWEAYNFEITDVLLEEHLQIKLSLYTKNQHAIKRESVPGEHRW